MRTGGIWWEKPGHGDLDEQGGTKTFCNLVNQYQNSRKPISSHSKQNSYWAVWQTLSFLVCFHPQYCVQFAFSFKNEKWACCFTTIFYIIIFSSVVDFFFFSIFFWSSPTHCLWLYSQVSPRQPRSCPPTPRTIRKSYWRLVTAGGRLPTITGNASCEIGFHHWVRGKEKE